jgi:hypothetical protein
MKLLLISLLSLSAPRVATLSVSAFPKLPSNVAKELKRRHCRIPQLPGDPAGRRNVIQGEFAKPGQTDWAVLCRFQKTTKILAFWSGLETNPSEEEAGPITARYALYPAERKWIVVDPSLWKGTELPPIDHQGLLLCIVTSDQSQSFATMYYLGGRWLALNKVELRVYY